MVFAQGKRGFDHKMVLISDKEACHETNTVSMNWLYVGLK